MPLLISAIFSETITRRLLSERAIEETRALAARSSSVIDAMLLEYEATLEALATDPTILRALAGSGSLAEEERATIFDRIYLVRSGRQEKPAIHLIDMHGGPPLSTGILPREYDPTLYGTWGIFRRARAEPGETVLFAQGMPGRVGEPTSLSLARMFYPDAGRECCIIIDLAPAQFDAVLAPLLGTEPVALVVMSDNGIPLYRRGTLKQTPEAAPGEHPAASRAGSLQSGLSVEATSRSATTGVGISISRALDERISGSSLARRVLLAAALLIAVLSVILAAAMARGISKPLYRVIDSVGKVREGDFSARTGIQRRDEIGILAESIDTMSAKIESLVEGIRRKERSLRIAELGALQAQIRPHFLFNCLDLIRWSAKLGDSAAVTDTVLHLSRLLRSSMRNTEALVSLGEELEFIRSYLAIQERRFADRLKVTMEIDDSIGGCRIPRFLIQPLVENAVIHGIEAKPGNGMLSISAAKMGSSIHLHIEDDGAGFAAACSLSLPGQDSWKPQGTGIGIPNVLARLGLHYSGNYRFCLESAPGKGTAIDLTIPFVPEAER